ncbi:hypothetical protein EDC14_1004122 [Hydrogenispora ethanolica]|uniref:Uncharacterized protein n=1 Tax=Hydrogenispora ethanolica TaxID=1082276 RepID=A0A4R1S590_HYDET|nr:hypothetical protein [Hydrogenispora ethanolica]TCL74184.1 hypothetical protein EDC14_1004122 [Hydrogenispora ethanolica]
MKKLFVGLFILICFSFNVFAEGNYDSQPFNNHVEKLPPNYLGHDIIKLYDDLNKQFPKKDEFETSAAYIKRLQAANYNNLYAFNIENESSEYNADLQRFETKILVSSAMDLDDSSIERFPVITTRTIHRETTTYTASNAYGASVQVKKYSGKEYGIGLTNKNDLKMEKYDSYFRTSFQVAPEKARTLKTNLGILLLCKLNIAGQGPSYVFRSFFYGKPTIDKPTEFSYSQCFIFAEVHEIWIYNFATGEIFKKIILKK